MALEILGSIIQIFTSFLSILALFFAVSIFKMRKEIKIRKALNYFIIALFVQSARSIYLSFGGPFIDIEWSTKFFEFTAVFLAVLGTYELYKYYSTKEK